MVDRSAGRKVAGESNRRREPVGALKTTRRFDNALRHTNESNTRTPAQFALFSAMNWLCAASSW